MTGIQVMGDPWNSNFFKNISIVFMRGRPGLKLYNKVSKAQAAGETQELKLKQSYVS